MPFDSELENYIVWEPIPDTSQELALDTPAQHTLYTGARGPGKTDTQLMRFRNFVGQGYGPFWRGVIFDREYKNLDDLVSKSKRWFNAFNDGARFLESKSDYKWVWPTGEELLFRSLKKNGDYNNYHGQEFPFIGFNELTKYPTPDLYDMISSCNRSSFKPEKDTPLAGNNGGPDWTKEELIQNGGIKYDTEDGLALPNIPLEMFSTCNPWGAGHAWVKDRFIDPVPYGKVIRVPIEVFNPQTQKLETIMRTQVAIFGSYRENIYLDPIYVASLETITDENLRKAWRDGNWDIVAGGALSDLWRKAIHIIPRFKVPNSWHVDRAMDWGSSHPTSVGWFAEANGEEATLPDGRKFCPPPGTIIQIAEMYFTPKIGTNKGMVLSARDVALKVKAMDEFLIKAGFVAGPIWPGPADNQIRDVREVDVETIETKMASVGIRWEVSDKSAGSRKNGLQLARDRLEASVRGEGAGWYMTENCIASIKIIPNLPRDEDNMDDIDTTAEDHPWDMTRYRLLKGGKRLARTIKMTMPT